MAKANCNISKDNVSTLVDGLEYDTIVYDNYISSFFGDVKGRSKVLSDELLKEGYDYHTFVPQAKVSAAAIRLYGKKETRKLLAVEIEALLDANPNIVDMVHKFALVRAPAEIRMHGKRKGEQIHEGLELDLSKFPESTLKLIRNKVYDLVTRVNMMGIARAKIGSHFSTFKSPSKLKWLDPTGAFNAIADGVRDHAGKISSQINYIMSAPEFIPIETKKAYKKMFGKVFKAKRGMAEILDAVEALADRIENTTPELKKKMSGLFAMAMRNWAFIDSNGKWQIHEHYAPRFEMLNPKTNQYEPMNRLPTKKDKNYRMMRYEPRGGKEVGDIMWAFQEPTPLKTYEDVEHGINKGDLYIEMNDSLIKEFKSLMDEARVLSDITFAYIVPQMEEATEAILEGLYDHYDGKLEKWKIKRIFFYNETTIKDPITFEKINLLEGLTSSEIDEINIVKETFAVTMGDGLVIANHGAYIAEEPEFRKYYWPTIYQKDVFKTMVADLVNRYTKQIDTLKDKLPSLVAKPKEYSETEKLIELTEEKLESATTIMNNMDGYHLDAQNDALMHLAKDNKHFKAISNAYDIRSGRRDKGLYYDYLANMMGSLERNRLNLTLLETLRRLKEDRLNKKPKTEREERIAIRNAAVNLHRTTYHSVKTMGMWGDMESFTRITNVFRYMHPGNWWRKLKDPSISIAISPELQSKYLRTFTTKLSGLFLQNPRSALTNIGGAYQNVLNHGMKRTFEAIKMYYQSGPYTKGIEKMIQQSGITEFSDFFSKAMVNGILENQVENEISEQILREMLLYHDRIKGSQFTRKMSKKESKQIFEDNIRKLLAQSKVWMKAEQVYIKDRAQVHASLKETQADAKLYAANKLVQWAIQKEYALKPLVKDTLWKRWAYLPLGSAVVKMSDLWQSSTMLKELTMANTEKAIRSISFIVGVQNAWETGIIRNDIHWSQYKKEEDIAAAILIGREYSYFNNFGMSTQDVASYQYGPGQMIGKFKYWSQQKAEADVNTMVDYMLSIRSKRDKGLFRLKPIIKMFQKANSLAPNRKTQRLAHPELAAMRTLWQTQGLMTLMYNIFLFNPLSLKHFKRARRIAEYFQAGQYGAAPQQLRSTLHSDVMHLATLPLAFGMKAIIQGMFGGDDDLEDLDKSINHHLHRVPFAGYIVSWGVNAVFALAAGLMDEEDLFVKRAEQTMSIFYGRPSLFVFDHLRDWTRNIGQAGAEIIYENVID
tara:strand:+ start:16515 stop:20189 length:3675 start_codon:yes stop_codon:yes gene_type:complete